MAYRACPGQVGYGFMVGILLLETQIPFIPGDVGNASTFPFPVRYKQVKGASIQRLIKERDQSLLEPFIDAGKALIREGVKAITGDCGYMVIFQKELSRQLSVPVFMSSLLQLPFLCRMVDNQKKVGIIVADQNNFSNAHLQAAGISDFESVVVAGMQEQPYFHDAILAEKGNLDFAKVEAEAVSVAGKLVSENDDIAALLLECSDLPPYAAAIQREVNLPVYDFTTMINYVFSGLVRREFHGYF